MRRLLVSAVVLGAAALPLGAGMAKAQSVVDADALWDEGELRQAREAYRRALDAGGLEPSQTAKAHLRIGIIAAAYGDDETANAAFRRALAIEPALPAPADLSPAQRDVFEEVRAQSRPIEVRALETERTAERVVLTARVTGGELFGATAALVRDGEQSERLELTTADFGTLTELPLAAVAVDEHGNVVALATESVNAPRATGAPPSRTPTEEPQEEGSRRGLFIALGIVAAVIVVGAVGLGLALGLGDESPQYSDAMVEF